MKTLEEAFESDLKINEEIYESSEMPLNVRNTIDVAKDVMESDVVIDYCELLVKTKIEDLRDGELSDELLLFNFSVGLMLTGFVAGLRVGKEMEKQDFDPLLTYQSLHSSFDVLLAGYLLEHPGSLPSEISCIELMKWSSERAYPR